jgi:hypothetical protein
VTQNQNHKEKSKSSQHKKAPPPLTKRTNKGHKLHGLHFKKKSNHKAHTLSLSIMEQTRTPAEATENAYYRANNFVIGPEKDR